ncbi:MAG: hypothetical protein PHE73_00525 [Sulfurovaceae bacterium]|nr:hypothetical protein [Sulfurovaceae bacterium]
MKKILVIASMMLLGFSGAYAVGTVAGTQVQNSVTLNYTVGGIGQTAINANDGAGFLVDDKVDFTVANNDGAQITVTPGSTGQITNWTLANTGNAAQFFKLAATNLTGGEIVYGNADTADTSTPYTITYSTDGGTTYNPYTPGTAFSVAIGASVLIRVAADIPLSVTNGQVMNIQLEATAAVDAGGTTLTATSGPDNIGSVDIVLAEGTGITTQGNTPFDGKFSAWGGYIVQSAALAVTKTSCVISDPVNGTTNPKRIPGAVLRYQIQVANTGTSGATSVTVADAIPTEFGTSAANLDVRSAVCPAISSGVCGAKTGTVETNAGTTGAGTSSVTLDYAAVAAGDTNCGYIEVTIQ